MNLAQAIEIKEDTLYKRHLHHQDKIDEADRLSIEALKRFEQQRQDPHCRGFWKLPGETKD
ncbi:hypothetical protein ES708_33119 [subsurface metagenome]